MAKRRRNFRWVKWLFFLVLIAAAVVVVILVKNNMQTVKTGGGETQKVEPAEGSVDEKTEAGTEGTSEGERKVPQYEGESPNKSETLTGLMSYADVVNDELVIRVNIDQFLQSGSCNLTISRNGVTYHTQTVNIVESVSTSTCDGFKIPVSELSKGDLQVEIDLESDGKSGKITGRVRI